MNGLLARNFCRHSREVGAICRECDIEVEMLYRKSRTEGIGLEEIRGLTRYQREDLELLINVNGHQR